MYALCSLVSLTLGFIIDIIIGDPDFIYHPIRLIGKLIAVSEKAIRKIVPDSKNGLICGGALLVLSVCGISTAVCVALLIFAYRINIFIGIALEGITCWFMLAVKSLKDESMKVYYELKKNDVNGARKAVSRIVGRDTERLDEKGIIKATVETVAENTSDGAIAPMLFMALGGAVGGVLYKAVNTMDSMTGYKNERYIYFGRIPAKTDDIANFIPSRISAYIMILSACILGFDGKNAYRIYKRDRYKHASPNSAHTEAVCAGALGIRLAGNAFYFGKLYEKEYIGDDVNEINSENIRQANKLMYMTAFISMLIIFIVRLTILLILRWSL